MSEHVFDDLPRLLTGEANRDTVSASAAHLRSCEDCRHELISAVVSHAALTSAIRFAPDLMMGNTDDLTDDAEQSELPDLSSIFAQIRSEGIDSPGPESGQEQHVHSGRTRWLVAASVAAVLVAGGSIAAVVTTSGSGPASQNVALAAFDRGTTSADVKLVGGDEMKLNASSLPALSSNEYYEVWLTDGARINMLPVGPLKANRTGDYAVPPAVMQNYAAVEVSVQKLSGTGVYSGVSVLRGNYA